MAVGTEEVKEKRHFPGRYYVTMRFARPAAAVVEMGFGLAGGG